MIKKFSIFEYQNMPQRLPADLHLAYKSGDQVYFENEDLLLDGSNAMSDLKTASFMAYLTMNKLYFEAYLRYLESLKEACIEK